MQVLPAPNGDGSVGRVSYRWVAMGVCLVGTFMVVLDTTIVNLALPSLQREYHTIDGVEWVITAYLAAVGVSQMGSSWFADRFGRKRSFVVTLSAVHDRLGDVRGVADAPAARASRAWCRAWAAGCSSRSRWR